eukprot:749465-Hanusia_phi.AAC.5
MVEAKEESIEIIGVDEAFERKAQLVFQDNSFDEGKEHPDSLKDAFVVPRDRVVDYQELDIGVDSDAETDESELDMSSFSKSYASCESEVRQEEETADREPLSEALSGLSLDEEAERIEDLKLFMNDFRSLGVALKDKWLEDGKFQTFYLDAFDKMRNGKIMEISGAEILLTTSMKEDYDSFVRAVLKKCLSKCIVASFDDGFAFEFEAEGEFEVLVRSKYGRQTSCTYPAQDWSFYVREGIQMMDLESKENIFNFLEEWRLFVVQNAGMDMKKLMAKGIFSF